MSPPKLVRVVFDTNALISAAIIPGSVSRRALLHAVQNFQLVHSDATWAELYEVIHRSKFDRYLPGNGRNDFLLGIARVSEFVDVSISITDCPDPKDNKFLELAVEAGAQIIVSGDGHLKNMTPYKGIDIITPAQMTVASPEA